MNYAPIPPAAGSFAVIRPNQGQSRQIKPLTRLPAIGVATARRHNPADATPTAEYAPLHSALSTLPSPAAGESSLIKVSQAFEPEVWRLMIDHSLNFGF